MNNRVVSILFLAITISVFSVVFACSQDSYEYKTYENKTGETINRFWIEIGSIDKGRIIASFRKEE